MNSRGIARALVVGAGRAVPVVVGAAFIGPWVGAGAVAAAQDARFDLIALTGDPAPGLADTTFGRLSSPRLNDRGVIVLVSELEGAGVTDGDNGALWVQRVGEDLRVVLRKGDPAPITAPTGEPVDFVAFPYPALNPAGFIAFTGSTADLGGGITGPDGIFRQDLPGFLPVAQAFYPPEPGYFTSLPVAPLTPEGRSPFNADGQGFIGDPLTLDRLLGAGDPAPGTGAGFAIDFVDLPQVSARGDVALRASVGSPLERFDRFQSLWQRIDGGPVELVVWADPREPSPGEILFTDFDVAPSMSSDGDMFFWASIRGHLVTDANDAAIWTTGGFFPVEEIIREGDPVLELGPGVSIGKLSRKLAVNDFDQMALMTSLTGAAVTADDNTAILASERGNPFLGVVVREGDPAPGAAGAAGAVFHVLSDPAINHVGQVAFLAQLRGGGLELDEKFGLYATDRQGRVHEIVRTGTPFDVRGDGTDIREVRQIEFASDPGRTGHSQFAADGSLAVLITFEGWDSGIYVASVGCLADADGDGDLTFFDFLTFQDWFAAGDPRADFDADGAFTFFDFLAFQDAFAAGCD